MKSFLKTLLAVIVANIILVMFGVFMLASIGLIAAVAGGGSDADQIEDGSYLVLDLYGDVLAYDPPQSVLGELFGGDQETVHRILTNLEKAAVDDRIAGVLVKVGSNNIGMASTQEIRDAIRKVSAAGKTTIAYSDNLSRSSLFLAAACDSVCLSPGGDLTFTGMGFEREYYKGALDKLGVHPNIHKIAEYKSAAEPFIREDMSPEAREMLHWILDEVWDMEMTALAEDRGLTVTALEDAAGHALFTSDEALEAGLVDRTVYWTDLTDELKGHDDYLATVSSKTYADVSRESVGLKGHDRIAVVHAQGMIGGRSNRVDPYVGVLMGHQTIGAALRKAAEDDKIDAIVFRVDSPGGSTLTSDLIAHEVERAAMEKPVIISMLDVAASGGYMISYKGTKMVADPMTITGSIGSIYGKFNLAGMFNKVGITFDSATKGENALFWSDANDFSEKQWERFVDHHYDGFNVWLRDVARRRGMTVEQAEKLANGRVWTGRQAKANGLIDDVGGLQRAIEIAKEEAGLAPDHDVQIVDYPEKESVYSLLASGHGLTAAANQLAYRLVHQELAETFRLLTQEDLSLWTGEFTR